MERSPAWHHCGPSRNAFSFPAGDLTAGPGLIPCSACALRVYPLMALRQDGSFSVISRCTNFIGPHGFRDCLQTARQSIAQGSHN